MTAGATNADDRPPILLFLALTAAISAPFYVLHAYSTTPGAGAYIRWLMWSPAIAAFLTLHMTGGDFASLGWKWPSLRFLAWSCVIPFLYLTTSYAIGCLLGGGSFPNERFIQATRNSFAWKPLPTWAVIAAYIVVNGSSAILMNTATALGEEIGWRGFLVPALARRHGFLAASLISGCIWGLWHFPLIFINQPFDWSNVYAAFCLLGGLIGISFAMTWLRLRSGSVWSTALFHAAHNAFNGMAGALIVPNALTSKLMDETGIMMVVAGAAVAIVFCMVNAKHPASANQRTAD